jgi:hypothetical protein
MNCIEFEAAIDRSVEQRTAVDPAALEHATACPPCRMAWERHCRLETAIAAWRPIERPTSLVDAVLAELRLSTESHVQHAPVAAVDEKGDRPVRVRSGGRAVMSVAAVLIVVAVFSSRYASAPFNLAHDTSGTDAQGNGDAPPGIDHSTLSVAQTLSTVLSDLKSEYHELASETSSAARELVNALPHRIVLPVGPNSAVNDVPLTELPLKSSDVARAWLPIGSRVETALGFLWQAIPNDVPAG